MSSFEVPQIIADYVDEQKIASEFDGINDFEVVALQKSRAQLVVDEVGKVLFRRHEELILEDARLTGELEEVHAEQDIIRLALTGTSLDTEMPFIIKDGSYLVETLRSSSTVDGYRAQEVFSSSPPFTIHRVPDDNGKRSLSNWLDAIKPGLQSRYGKRGNISTCMTRIAKQLDGMLSTFNETSRLGDYGYAEYLHEQGIIANIQTVDAVNSLGHPRIKSFTVVDPAGLYRELVAPQNNGIGPKSMLALLLIAQLQAEQPL